MDALAELFPAAVGLTNMIKNPQVHAGFYNQFASLAVTGVGPNNLTQQLLELSGGQAPLFVAISGGDCAAAHEALSAFSSSAALRASSRHGANCASWRVRCRSRPSPQASAWAAG